jgi:hypothetical protein
MVHTGCLPVSDGDCPATARGPREGGGFSPAAAGPAGPLLRAGEIEARARAIEALSDAGVRFMVAGAYAFFVYTGIFRDTKDLDLMLLRRDVPAAFEALERAGFQTDLLDPGWIGKAYAGESFIDLIFSSSNGLGVVDEQWFQNAWLATVLGHPCAVAPVEEIIFTKAFVGERERYDGADVNHLIYARGQEMDWERLLRRFGPHWEVLFSHVSLYRFVYPCARGKVPDWLVRELCRRTLADSPGVDAEAQICRGNLVSGRQYRHDYEMLGLEPAPT